MKKNLMMLTVVFMITALLMVSAPLKASSAEDYKVIKKAAKGKKGGDITWFRIEVTDKKTKKASVKIKIPFALVDMLTDCVKDDIKIKDDKCDIDFKKVMKILKQHGPMTIVEVDEEDSKVRIWFE